MTKIAMAKLIAGVRPRAVGIYPKISAIAATERL